MSTSNAEVLIVGAGPTGLTMAIEMQRLGVPCRLIDRSPHPAEHSQALVVQARTLEQFERYGIAQSAVERGRPLREASFFSDGKAVFSFPFSGIPGRYPFVLFLPQNETEALLIEHLEQMAGSVERGVELLALSGRDDGVEVQLRGPDGGEEEVFARWVVGCDGAHSRVREELKIPFSGEQIGLNFFLGDLELDGPALPGDELRVYLHRGDVVFIGRLTEKLFRVIVAMHSEQGDGRGERKLEIADFQGPLDRAGIGLRVVSASWMTPFRVNDRRAAHIRKDRVFLAGDASHIHSPVGGQGMNTGIQDVANLAWKIAAVKDGADGRLLDSYEEERGRVSEELLKETSRVLKAATASNPWVEKARDLLLHTATQIPFIQEQMVGFVSETAIGYRHSTAVMDVGGGGGLRAGDRMPNPELVWKQHRMRLLDPMRLAGQLAIGFEVRNRKQIEESLPRTETLFLRTDEIQEGKEQIAELMGGTDRVMVIRPDGYVGFRGGAAEVEAMAKYARMTGLERRRRMEGRGPQRAA